MAQVTLRAVAFTVASSQMGGSNSAPVVEEAYQPLVINSDFITSRVSYNTHPVARSLLLVERGGVELPPNNGTRSPMENDEHLVWALETLPQIEASIAAAKRIPAISPVEALQQAANQSHSSPSAKVSTFATPAAAASSFAPPSVAMRRPAASMAPAHVLPAPAPRPRNNGMTSKTGGRV